MQAGVPRTDIGSAVWGIGAWLNHTMSGSVYFVLFGFAAIFFAMASHVLPSGTRNRRYGEEQWERALKALNPSVTVTQKEYDEVVVVKPLFTLMEYR